MPKFVDSHLHLQDKAFDSDRPAVIDQAFSVGVKYMVCNGSSESDWQAVQEICIVQPAVVAGFGLHPWYVRQRSPHWVQRLREMLCSVPSVVGEIGLDRWVKDYDFADQQLVFKAQLELASELQRPACIHCLKAQGPLLDMLNEHGPLPRGFMLHAYGGSADMVERFAALGGYFSFAAGVLGDNREKAKQALAAVPLDRLLLETDSPDILMPENIIAKYALTDSDAQRTKPSHLNIIAAEVAELLGIDREELTDRVFENSKRFFAGLLQ